jgi:hypothetical protein
MRLEAAGIHRRVVESVQRLRPRLVIAMKSACPFVAWPARRVQPSRVRRAYGVERGRTGSSTRVSPAGACELAFEVYEGVDDFADLERSIARLGFRLFQDAGFDGPRDSIVDGDDTPSRQSTALLTVRTGAPGMMVSSAWTAECPRVLPSLSYHRR